jgi:hypothetical protein
MIFRRLSACLLVGSGALSLWELYWVPVYGVILHSHQANWVWLMLLMFSTPLVVVGSVLCYSPYRFWSGRALPFFGYVGVTSLISGYIAALLDWDPLIFVTIDSFGKPLPYAFQNFP